MTVKMWKEAGKGGGWLPERQVEGRLQQNASDGDMATLEGRSMAAPGQLTGKVTAGPEQWLCR